MLQILISWAQLSPVRGELQMSVLFWAHLQCLCTEDVLVQQGDQGVREMAYLLICLLTASLHTAGHTLQELRQLLLYFHPLGVGGTVLFQLI